MIVNGLDELAIQMLDSIARCFKCRMCVTACPTYEGWLSYSPIGRILAINYHFKYGLGSKEELSDLLFSCAICRRCQERCKAVGTGSNPTDVIVKARTLLIRDAQTQEGGKR